MGIFAQTLRRIRKELTPLSAKSAWQKWQKKGLSVNYAYYMKLEKGDMLPSPEVVEQLVRHLSYEHKESLIYAYCQEMFPNQKELFQIQHSPLSPPSSAHSSLPSKGQYELSPRQISTLASHKSYYHIFVVLILARKKIPLKDLSKIVEMQAMDKKIKTLEEHGLVIREDEMVHAISTEVRFPKATTLQLKEDYAKFDDWDQEFTKDFAFEKVFEKRLLRRVSPRYLEIINQQLELTTELVKTSDELNSSFNSDVIFMEINLTRGKVPG
ncbi:MAG: hypothetical protein ACLGGX_11885 [Bdellovibrionia bacterium]